MPLVVGAVVIGLVLAIAAVFVIREAGRLAQEPPPPLFDTEEAYEWVVAELPDDDLGDDDAAGACAGIGPAGTCAGIGPAGTCAGIGPAGPVRGW